MRSPTNYSPCTKSKTHSKFIFEVMEATGNFIEDRLLGGGFVSWSVFLFKICIWHKLCVGGTHNGVSIQLCINISVQL